MSTTEEWIREELAADPAARILAVVPDAERRCAVQLACEAESDVRVVALGDGHLLGRRYDVILLEAALSTLPPEQREWMDRAVMPRLAPTGYLTTNTRAA